MEVSYMIDLALFIPFVVVFAICCTFFLISGYKKGFWRSIISLGASMVGLFVSMLLGRLCGRLLAGPIMGTLPTEAFADMGAMGGFAATVVQSVIQVALSLVLFGLFFMIAVIVLKNLAKNISCAQIEKESKDKKWLSFAGMGIRWLDAVIVSLAILLPLYGSLSVVAPPAASIASAAGSSSSSAAQVLRKVEQHPMVAAYKTGPAALVVEGVSNVSIGGESFAPTEIMEALDGTINRYIAFAAADGEPKAEALAELVRYLRTDVIEKDWSYDIICIVRQEMGKYLEQEDDPIGQQIYALTDMTKAEYESNGVALLEFLDYALSNDFMIFYRSSDYEALSPEFYEKLGALINHSNQAVALKKTLMKESAAALFNDVQQASTFIDQYISNEPTAEELQEQEGEAFMRLFFEDRSQLNLVEAFVRHPSISYADAKELLTEEILADEYGFWMSVIENSDQILAELQVKLATYDTAPLTNETFSHYANSIVIPYINNGFFYSDISDNTFAESTDGEIIWSEDGQFIYQTNPDGSITVIIDGP